MKTSSRFFTLLATAISLIHSLGVSASELPYYISKDMTPRWEQELPIDDREPGRVAVNIHEIADFQLTNQNGLAVSGSDLSGQPLIVNFFFTTCPGICPTSMKNLQRVQKKLDSEPVTMVSISITPNIDSPDKLKLYADSYGIDSANWLLLTGEASTIDSLARESFFAVLDRNVSQNAFVHTEKVFLVDGDMHIRGVYNASAPGDLLRLIEDVHSLTGAN